MNISKKVISVSFLSLIGMASVIGLATPAHADTCNYEYVNGRMIYVCCTPSGYCYEKR
jgi:hypothetical protein